MPFYTLCNVRSKGMNFIVAGNRPLLIRLAPTWSVSMEHQHGTLIGAAMSKQLNFLIEARACEFGTLLISQIGAHSSNLRTSVSVGDFPSTRAYAITLLVYSPLLMNRWNFCGLESKVVSVIKAIFLCEISTYRPMSEI